MPELPEVETTRKGIEPHILHKKISRVIIRQTQLRWPIPKNIKQQLTGNEFIAVTRRAKYLLLETVSGTVIIHLGMSGSLRICAADSSAEKHDHVDILFGDKCLRYRDPRRFGAILWTNKPANQHKLLKALGPEPLSEDFSADYLIECAARRKTSIKNFIMNSQIVVGVGNIYASEALFIAGIHPKRQANKIAKQRYALLVAAIKNVLIASIKQGGTSLKDFTQSDGQPGYFKQSLQVYGREKDACPNCGSAIKKTIIGQRSSFYCSRCQK